MAYKAINEKFPPEVWAEINAVKENCEMTWAEFLPYAAKCTEIHSMELETFERLDKFNSKASLNENVVKLLDCWDQCQREQDDGK